MQSRSGFDYSLDHGFSMAPDAPTPRCAYCGEILETAKDITRGHCATECRDCQCRHLAAGTTPYNHEACCPMYKADYDPT